jgi:phosphate:Na+ symporter
LEFAARRARATGGFAPSELEAIGGMHAELVQSLRLGLAVFLRRAAALREARQIVVRKRLLRRLEQEASRLGASDNSDFLRIVRDLRRVHSHIAALAYPVLERAAEQDTGEAEPQALGAPPRLAGADPPVAAPQAGRD